MLHNTALLVIFVFRNYTQLSLSPGDPVPAGSGRRLADAKTAIAGTDDGRGEKTGGPVYPGRLSVNNSDVRARGGIPTAELSPAMGISMSSGRGMLHSVSRTDSRGFLDATYSSRSFWINESGAAWSSYC